MRRVNRGGVLFALLAAVFAVTLCVAPTQAHASGKTVNLVADGGSVSPSAVELTDDGRLPALPTPSKTGWRFVGWYTGTVTYHAWTDTAGYNGQLPVPGGYTVDPVDGHHYSYGSDYHTWLINASGTRVNAGDSADVSTLYACFTPTTNTITLNWNGWQNRWGVLTVTREYGIPATDVVVNPWPGHELLGWYTSPNQNTGSRFDLNTGITSGGTYYAHYTGMADDPNSQRGSMIAASNIKVSPSSAVLGPSGDTVTLSASLTMLNSVVNPTASDWSNVKWSVVEGANLVSLSATSGQSCTVRTTGGTGTAKVQASFLNEKSRTIASTATITVKSHTHTFGAERLMVQPTCQKAGYGIKTCTVCGAEERVDHPKVSHTYKTETTTPADCTHAGIEKTFCTVCHTVASTKTLPATGHRFTTKSVQSCTGTVHTKTCTVCKFTEETNDASSGAHSWATGYTVDKPATCSTAGSESIHCTKCQVTKDSREIPANGNHVWGGWHTTKPATHDAKGGQERACTSCGKTETQELPMLVAEPATPTTPNAPNTPDTPETPSQPDQPDQQPNAPEQQPEPTPDQQPESTPVPEQTLYRLYNDQTGDHYYTRSAAERDQLISSGYHTEDMQGATALPEKSNTPVYQLDNPYTGEHHYTTSLNEYNTLCAAGWTGRGISFYSAEPGVGRKVYRLYNPFAAGTAAAHHYTLDQNEVNTLIGKGYQLDGEPGWYYLPA